MSEDQKNRTYYKETFREVHAPQDLVERLMEMDRAGKRKKAGSAVKRIAVAAVAAVCLFAGSNGVAYAMTGSTWVKTLVYRITLNGVEYDVDMESHRKEDGTMRYTGSVQHGNGDVTEVEYEEYGRIGSAVIHTKKSAGLSLAEDRIRIIDGDIEIDITEEINEKGMVSGSYERNGYTKVYKIIKQGEGIIPYIITVENGIEEAWKEIEKLEESNKIRQGERIAEPTPAP